MNFCKVVQGARDAFEAGRTKNVEFRKRQLQGLLRMYEENEAEFVRALLQDLKKPRQESVLMELNFLKDDVNFVLSHVDDWTQPEKVPSTLVTMFDKCLIYPDPFGVVLVMGAWNYPLQLPLLPISGAIAAGNCVIIKPSEVSPASAKVISDLIPKYLDPDCYKVVCGGIPETTELLKQKFDYIFYTGSTQVGKIIREASNKHLTPTTLELGGKSPVFLDDTVDMDIAVRRILWGKCVNLGQTCVAPDYLLTSESTKEKFIEKTKEVLAEWYGSNMKTSPDLGRIVNDRHFKRLQEYLKDGKIALGGDCDAEDRWISPTILTNVPVDSKVMSEEIFGPILPIITVKSAPEAIQFVNSRNEPLSLYVFSTDSGVQSLFLNNAKCGAMCINDCVVHLSVPGLPFGGVGNSGMGCYHGKASFECFSHRKSCLVRNYNKIADYIGKSRYPPYSEDKISFLSKMLKERSFPSFKYVGYTLAFTLGALSVYAGQEIAKVMMKDGDSTND